MSTMSTGERSNATAASRPNLNTRLMELRFAASEYEEELEARDFAVPAKSTQTVNIKHLSYACIGTDTTHKQRSIKKLFINGL